MKSRMITAILLVGALLVPAVSMAKKPKKGPRVIELDTIVVEGKIQKPEAFYILNRSDLDFRPLELKRSFLKNILSTLKRKPF